MTNFEGKMWNLIGSVSWVESGYSMEPMLNMMMTENDATLSHLTSFLTTRSECLVQRVRDYELASGVNFDLTDKELTHVATEVVSRGKLTYDTYMAFPTRLTGLHNDYHYTLPRLARVHN